MPSTVHNWKLDETRTHINIISTPHFSGVSRVGGGRAAQQMRVHFGRDVGKGMFQRETQKRE